MVDNIIKQIKKNLTSKIEIIRKKQENIKMALDKEEKIDASIKSFLQKFHEEKTLNFDFLEEFMPYLIEHKIIEKNVNYRELLKTKEQFELYFPNRTFPHVEKKFNDLIKNLETFLNNRNFSRHKSITRERSNLEYEFLYCNKLLVIINKVLNNEIIYDEDISLLDKFSEIDENSRLQLYLYIVSNNYAVMQKKVINEKERQLKVTSKRKILEKRAEEISRKREVQNTQEPVIVDEFIDENLTERNTTDKEKDLLKKAEEIIAKTPISDEISLKVFEGLNEEEILEFLEDFQKPEEQLALVLKDIIIPKIKEGSLDNIEQLLNLYINKYEELTDETKKTIPYRLKSVNKSHMLELITKVEEMLKCYEEHKEEQDMLYMSGYYIKLKEIYKDFIFAISIDDFLNSSEEIEEFYKELQSAVVEVEKNSHLIKTALPQTNESSFDDTISATQLSQDFYGNQTKNFIIFPKGIDFSEQVDNDKTLNFAHKKKIFNGLKKISTDEEILTSSNHKIKDHDSKYEELRRYSGYDYRIIYRASRAEGLENFMEEKLMLFLH